MDHPEFANNEFVAPFNATGVHIWSTYPGEDYAHFQGTSMSSPHVTGAAALLLSENPDLSAVEVLNQVEQTAAGSGFTEELGHGILDVEALLGDIQPLNYGSLLVRTDREGSIITGCQGEFFKNFVSLSNPIKPLKRLTGKFSNNYYR